MVEEDAAAFLGNVFGHSVEELAINKKLDTTRGPVKAVLVELFVWAEWKLLDYEAVCSLGSEAVGDGLGALENQVYGALGFIELMREEFHVDFLRVVVVLRLLARGHGLWGRVMAAYKEECTASSRRVGQLHANTVAAE